MLNRLGHILGGHPCVLAIPSRGEIMDMAELERACR
jgi:hypothetical protein